MVVPKMISKRGPGQDASEVDYELQIATGDYDKSVLIATIEHEIPDWSVKVKVGGLGAMASLQAKTTEARELFWVVPCFGDVEYLKTSGKSGSPLATFADAR
jgi:hypothetical protein